MNFLKVMNNKILLSIAIPTYNRACFLENLLNNTLPQARELEGGVEICISNNGSTDNTDEVVRNLKQKYPDLIKYNENKKNLGLDRNLLKLMEMSNGSFIWTFGDDDNIVENGLNEVVKFIKKIPEENTGLAVLRTETYFIDRQTGKKIIYYSSLDKNQPEIFTIDKKDIIGIRFPKITFISLLLFNNKAVKRILKEDRAIIEKGIGTDNIHMLLYNLMFLKYPYIDGIAFNKKIVSSELPCYKFFIEDRFEADYKKHKKLYRLLLSNKYMNDDYAFLLAKKDKGLRRSFIIEMTILRAFKSFNYFSYFGCLKLFFRYAAFIDALLFSLVFSTLFLIPPAILRFVYKVLLMVRCGKKWKSRWRLITNINYRRFKGDRRQ